MSYDYSELKLNVIFTENGYYLDDMYSSKSDEYNNILKIYYECPERFIYSLAFKSINEYSRSIQYIYRLSRFFLKSIMQSPEFRFNRIKTVDYTEFDSEELLSCIPMVLGYQYIDKKWIYNQYLSFAYYLERDITDSQMTPLEFISQKGVNTVIPSRIYFHLVENNDYSDYPFAYMATYTAEVNDKVVHIPLKNALQEYKDDKESLDYLITSINRASEESGFVKKYLDNGKIFFPIRLTDDEAYAFLKDVPSFEKNGIVCRIPKWSLKKNSKILVDINEKKMLGGYLKASVISTFSPRLIYNGIEISVEEAKRLLSQAEGLELIKGKWVEINHDDLRELIKEYEELSKDGTTIRELLYYKSSFIGDNNYNDTVPIEFTKEDWFSNHRDSLSDEMLDDIIPPNYLGVLRPYQEDAFFWLWKMHCFGFGVCLADDMGLGKTVEMLSFIKKYKNHEDGHVLLIVPAILVSNWISEINKFDTEIDYYVLGGNNAPPKGTYGAFLTITTYQIALKSEYIASVLWGILIVDEAQAIKNYYTGQTKKIKSLTSNMRVAITGTPIENNALDLWSIFDFINPGFLGRKDEFLSFYLNNADSNTRIKDLIQPFVLRRLKSDKKIIKDLPDKNEIDVNINMTPKQIVIYNKIVQEMNDKVSQLKGAEKNAIVLSTITKLKQLCNHPSQFLGDNDYSEEDSGKYIALHEICETMIAQREKFIIFTQFKEIIPSLVSFINTTFNLQGASIDGTTGRTQRTRIIEDFQNGKIPYLVLSIKAAGVGINLTAANNVILFDRWWNPAVENQAIDRAYRIGQTSNVNVYKFVTADSIEMVINDILKSKQKLADEIINDLDKEITSNITIDELMSAISINGGL